MRALALLALAPTLLCGEPAAAQLRGHGGPVRAVAATADGRLAISGGFDSTAILWAIAENRALGVLRLHDDAVTAVAALPDGRFATAGADGRIAFWRLGAQTPEQTTQAHAAQIVALAASPDGARLASASFDRTIRVVELASGAEQRFEGHRGAVNAVAFARDGRAVVSGGYDGQVRLTPLDGGAPVVVEMEAPIAALTLLADGRALVARADGALLAVDPATRAVDEIARLDAPASALAQDARGRIAVAALDGSIALADVARRRLRPLATKRAGPVWGLAFAGDELLAAGNDGFLRRYDLEAGAEIAPAAFAEAPELPADLREHPGARVFSACAACHALRPEEGRRAGPSLHGLMGRRIAAAPGYAYSDALRGLDIVWTKDTVARLFEIGPTLYTPGTKMPEQRVVDPAARAALVDFLERATR